MPLITQGKTNWKFLLIVIILAIIVGGGALWYAKRPEKPYLTIEVKKQEISQNLTPQETIQAWFEDQKKGDWQSVFANMVDVDGKPYSSECQDGFKKAFGANVGADYTLNIKNDLKTGTCKDLPELNLLAQSFGFQLPDGQCAIVFISYSTKSSGSVDTFLTLLKVNNDWKVMMYCKPLLSIGESTEKEGVIEGETANTPKEAYKIWFDNIIKGDWSKVFKNTATVKRETSYLGTETVGFLPLTEDCQKEFKDYYKNYVGADYSLNVEIKAEQCTIGTLYEQGLAIGGFGHLTCHTVQVTYNVDNKQLRWGKSMGGLGGGWPVVKVVDEWEVLVDCSKKIFGF